MIKTTKTCDVCGSEIYDIYEKCANPGHSYKIKECDFFGKWERIDVCWFCLNKLKEISRKENKGD